VLALVGVVVGCGIEVGVVHLGRTLRDVRRAARQVDAREAEPPVVAVLAVANLGRAGNHRAALVRAAGNDRRQHRAVAGVPVARCLGEVRSPVGAGQVVAQLESELGRLARPVVAAPRMGRGGDASNQGQGGETDRYQRPLHDKPPNTGRVVANRACASFAQAGPKPVIGRAASSPAGMHGGNGLAEDRGDESIRQDKSATRNMNRAIRPCICRHERPTRAQGRVGAKCLGVVRDGVLPERARARQRLRAG